LTHGGTDRFLFLHVADHHVLGCVMLIKDTMQLVGLDV
jgi:hypothetical protein